MMTISLSRVYSHTSPWPAGPAENQLGELCSLAAGTGCDFVSSTARLCCHQGNVLTSALILGEGGKYTIDDV